jgi:hypothetical protein
VHIEYLSKEVAKLAGVEVRCYGDQKPGSGQIKTTGYESAAGYLKLDRGLQSVFKTIDRDLQIVGEGVDADVVAHELPEVLDDVHAALDEAEGVAGAGMPRA